MTAENLLYALAGGIAASLLTTIFLCLVFYRTGPKLDDTEEKIRDVMQKQEARRHMTFHELAEDADKETMRIMRTWR